MTPPAPLWLAAPTRFAALSPRAAQVALGLIAALLLACFTALPAPAPPPVAPETTAASRDEDRADVVLYETIVAGLRNGGDYYEVAAQELRRGGYPLRPFVTFRLPTLARVQAMVPDLASTAMLFALAALTVAAWYRRLSPALTHLAPRLLVATLTLGGLASFIRADLVAFHEVWAGTLIALSLALRRPGNAATAIALALAAMLIRETAAL